LAESGDTETLASWRKLGVMDAAALAKEIPVDWVDLLMIPNVKEQHIEAADFAQAHDELLNVKIQEQLDHLTTFGSIRETARWMMALALFLAHAIGADAKGLSEYWIDIAKSHGAKEQ